MADKKNTVKATCKRNLVAKGYGYFKYDQIELPEDVFEDLESEGFVVSGHKDLKAIEEKAKAKK